jgi:hypothetical protein
MSDSPPTGSNDTSSTRLDSEHNPGLTTGTTVTNDTEGPPTPGHHDPAASQYDDETAMNSSPPSLNRGEPGDLPLDNQQIAEDVHEPDWDEISSDSPTPSASENYQDHISALGLLDSEGHDHQQESEMDSRERDDVNGNQEEGHQSGQSRT